MEWTIAFGALLALACYLGRPSPLVFCAMWGNLAATGAISNFGLTPWPLLAIGTVDILCATVLLCSNDMRAKVIGVLFALMVPIYVCGNFWDWPIHTTYGIIDAIALLQLGAVGGVDRGIRNRRRSADRRLHSSGYRLARGNAAPGGLVTKDNLSQRGR